MKFSAEVTPNVAGKHLHTRRAELYEGISAVGIEIEAVGKRLIQNYDAETTVKGLRSLIDFKQAQIAALDAQIEILDSIEDGLVEVTFEVQ